MKKNFILFCFLLICIGFTIAENREEFETPLNLGPSVCEVSGIPLVNYIKGYVSVNGVYVLGSPTNPDTLYTSFDIPAQSYVSVKVTNPSNTQFTLVYGPSCAGWSSSAGNLGFTADGQSGDQIVFQTNTDPNSYVFRLQ
ncbi:MAG: hypothetical protein LBU37_06625 [Tannerellaceae bacterium]|jgi:hypothetical protein|nr:hypothetical protein [Tannerellaceae bacterium]